MNVSMCSEDQLLMHSLGRHTESCMNETSMEANAEHRRVLGAKVFSRPLVTKGDVETWKDSFYRVYKSGQQSVRVAV